MKYFLILILSVNFASAGKRSKPPAPPVQQDDGAASDSEYTIKLEDLLDGSKTIKDMCENDLNLDTLIEDFERRKGKTQLKARRSDIEALRQQERDFVAQKRQQASERRQMAHMGQRGPVAATLSTRLVAPENATQLQMAQWDQILAAIEASDHEYAGTALRELRFARAFHAQNAVLVEHILGNRLTGDAQRGYVAAMLGTSVMNIHAVHIDEGEHLAERLPNLLGMIIHALESGVPIDLIITWIGSGSGCLEQRIRAFGNYFARWLSAPQPSSGPAPAGMGHRTHKAAK
ncbi:MAG: hypothetical protein V4534_00825 [Myxococcota bacterium]